RRCRARLLRDALFFALMADVSPQGVELSAAQFVILEQELFDLLHLRGELREPSSDGLFLDAFDALNSRQRIAFGQHGQTFKDRFFAVMLAVKESPASFGDDLSTGGALPTLAAFASEAEFPQIAGTDATIIGTQFVPAEGIWCGELLIVVALLRGFHRAG